MNLFRQGRQDFQSIGVHLCDSIARSLFQWVDLFSQTTMEYGKALVRGSKKPQYASLEHSSTGWLMTACSQCIVARELSLRCVVIRGVAM